MTQFSKKWQAAKTEFEKRTGLKKPRDAEKGLATAFGKHTGLTESLKDCDKASAVFEDAVDAYRTAMAKHYVQVSKAAQAYFKCAESFQAFEKSYHSVLIKAFNDPKNQADYRNELHLLVMGLFDLKDDVVKRRQHIAEQLLDYKPL